MDKPTVLLTAKELREKGVVPFKDYSELEGIDWNDPKNMERGYLTQYEGSTNDVMKGVMEEFKKAEDTLKEKYAKKWQDFLDKADKESEKARPEIRTYGQQLIQETDPRKRSDGLFLLCYDEIGRMLKEIAETKGHSYDIAALREITKEAQKKIDEAGLTKLPVGRMLTSPAMIRANMTTTDGAGGYLIEDVFEPMIIDRLFEEFPLMGRFKLLNVGTSVGVVPRIGTGSTAYRRTEGSAGTATGITDTQLSFTCTPLTAFSVITKEFFKTAHPGLQAQSLIVNELARAISYKYKTEFASGSGSSQGTGLETENTSGYVHKFTLDGSNRVQSCMEGMKLLGGSKNVGWLNQAVVVANKAAVWAVADEIYTDGRYKLDMSQPITSLVVRGLRYEMVETIPNNVYWIFVPSEYLVFKVPSLTEMSMDGAGYTHQTTNTFTIDYNEHSDMKLSGNGLGSSYKDRYAAVRVGPAA